MDFLPIFEILETSGTIKLVEILLNGAQSKALF